MYRGFPRRENPLSRLVTCGNIDYSMPSGDMNGYRVLWPAFMPVGYAITTGGCTGNTKTVSDAGEIVATPVPIRFTGFTSQQKANAANASTGNAGEAAACGNLVALAEGSSAAHPRSLNSTDLWFNPPGVVNATGVMRAWRFHDRVPWSAGNSSSCSARLKRSYQGRADQLPTIRESQPLAALPITPACRFAFSPTPRWQRCGRFASQAPEALDGPPGGRR
jgi:hypothetical protein